MTLQSQRHSLEAKIIAIGTAVPQGRFSQVEAATELSRLSENSEKQSKLLNNLFNRSGINHRSATVFDYEAKVTTLYETKDQTPKGPSTHERMVRYESDVLPLAIEATRKAFATCEIEPGEITHLVTASCTGFAAPGFDLGLMSNIPLSADTARTHVGFMGCHGAMNALRIAKAFIDANPNSKVLLCAAELCSLHFQYGWESNNMVANSLFADGAAAVIISGADSKSHGVNIRASSSYIVPSSAGYMTWKIHDHGFSMTLDAELPFLIEKVLPDWLTPWLASFGLSIQDIASWAVHPGGKRILDAVESCFNLDPSSLLPSRSILADHGNMSSPTILFILERLLQTDSKPPVVMLAFGPGITIEAALLG